MLAVRVFRFELDGRSVMVVSAPSEAAPERLTPAELAVAKGLLRGASQRAIGIARGASARTIANQVQSIYRKWGVSSREELAVAWSREGAEQPGEAGPEPLPRGQKPA